MTCGESNRGSPLLSQSRGAATRLPGTPPIEQEHRVCSRALALWLHWRSVKGSSDASIADFVSVRRAFVTWSDQVPLWEAYESSAAQSRAMPSVV